MSQTNIVKPGHVWRAGTAKSLAAATSTPDEMYDWPSFSQNPSACLLRCMEPGAFSALNSFQRAGRKGEIFSFFSLGVKRRKRLLPTLVVCAHGGDLNFTRVLSVKPLPLIAIGVFLGALACHNSNSRHYTSTQASDVGLGSLTRSLLQRYPQH